MAGKQPSNIEPYLQPDNAATRNPLEDKLTGKLHHHDNEKTFSSGTSTSAAGQSRSPIAGVPTSRGLGVHGSEPIDSLEARNTHVGSYQAQTQNENVDAEQMATLAEGKVADAVDRKSGTQQVPGQGPAEEQDFASDLDR